MSKTEFKPFDRVLVRANNEYEWQVDFFSHYEEDDNCMFPRYICIGSSWHKCIPYEGNEHLIGTTDAPKYKWEPKKGDIVSVSEDGVLWVIAIFCECGAVDGKLFYRAITTALSSCFSWNFCEPAEKHFPELRVKNEDAAEFEARVAVKLALNPTRNSQPCPYGNSRTCTCECDSKHRSCVDNRLKWARLAVEAEMDAEHDNEA